MKFSTLGPRPLGAVFLAGTVGTAFARDKASDSRLAVSGPRGPRAPGPLVGEKPYYLGKISYYLGKVSCHLANISYYLKSLDTDPWRNDLLPQHGTNQFS